MSKIKKAAALKYENGYEAPLVTAAGLGYVADEIIKRAEENEVPVVYDEQLADLLNNVDVGQYIPYELYDAVAEVIAYIIDMNEKAKGR